MLGEIVHNRSVVDQIQRAGIRVVDRIDDIPAGVLLFRAHGSTRETCGEAEARGLKIVEPPVPWCWRSTGSCATFTPRSIRS